jgi:hypothetical protein
MKIAQGPVVAGNVKRGPHTTSVAWPQRKVGTYWTQNGLAEAKRLGRPNAAMTPRSSTPSRAQSSQRAVQPDAAPNVANWARLTQCGNPVNPNPGASQTVVSFPTTFPNYDWHPGARDWQFIYARAALYKWNGSAWVLQSFINAGAWSADNPGYMTAWEQLTAGWASTGTYPGAWRFDISSGGYYGVWVGVWSDPLIWYYNAVASVPWERYDQGSWGYTSGWATNGSQWFCAIGV